MKCLHVVGAAAVHLCAQGSWAALALFPSSHCFAQHIFTGSTKLSFTADHIWLSTHWKITKPPVGTVSRIFNSIRGKKKKRVGNIFMLGYMKLKLPDVFRVSMRGDIFSWSFLWAVERRGETVTFGPPSDCRPLLKQDSSRVSLLCPCTRVGHARPHSPVYSAQGAGLPTPSPTLKVFIIFRHCDYWPEKKNNNSDSGS